MIRIWSDPHPDHLKDRSNGIAQVIYHLSRELPAHGFVYANRPEDADLIVRHAGARGGSRVDVTHNHGLLPTGMRDLSAWAWSVNADVIDNLVRAKEITVPSEWVGDAIRRDMRVNPTVTHWGIDAHEWQPGQNDGYVLWAKGRSGDVCDPEIVNRLAHRMPDASFITTFGETMPHVKVVGMQPFDQMKHLIQNAGVYLATTRETFGIQTLEAMACGVPVLGFRWAATPDLIEHGETGYLAEPGNIDDLAEGLRYCQRHRKRLGAAAREKALTFTWSRTAQQIAAIYRRALEPHIGPKVSIVIPCFNYAKWVGEAIESALAQGAADDLEVIVVDDGSKDGSAEIAERYPVQVIRKDNGGVASARNRGADEARGKYIAFLDADDLMEPGWLKANLSAIEKNDRIGIAYTPLRLLRADGSFLSVNWPPQRPDPQRQLNGENLIPTCCLIRREAFNRAGGYRQRFEPTEDGELWTKIIECGYEVVCSSPKPLFTYRTGHASLSRRNPKTPDYYMPWHTPSQIGEPPFAAAGRPPLKSWPVRDYDRPVISIIVRDGADAALIETLDSLLAQSYRFWEVVILGDARELQGYPFTRWAQKSIEARAPLAVIVKAGEVLDPFCLENNLLAWQERGQVVGLLRREQLEDVCAENPVAVAVAPSIITTLKELSL
jgi:glycosyltransferase involved in cell wall biosynthesis